MKKKRLISIPLGVILSLLTVAVVLAGTTSDIGTLAGTPLASQANWTAWVNVFDYSEEIPVLIYPPAQVITEDNSNAAGGANLGYTDAGWFIQVENLQDAVNRGRVNMSFGGLSTFSGSHWYYSWQWDGVLDSQTTHPLVPLSTSTGSACPTLYPVNNDTVLLTNTVTFSGDPNTTYHVYRSTSPSGTIPPNGASNGRYNLQGTATTNTDGFGTFIDSTPGITTIPSWYLIIYFGTSSTLGSQGCHSEPVNPTSVDIADLTATYNPGTNSVNVEWETVSDANFIGFNVIRSESEHGLQVQLNPETIDVYQIGSVLGHNYSFLDVNVELGKTYYYWLEVIEFDNSLFYFGPESVTTGYFIYIPLLVK